MRHPKAGGAEEYLHRQAQYWIGWGHSVKWYSARFEGSLPRENLDGIDIYRSGGEFTTYAYAPWTFHRYMSDCEALIDAENGIPFFSPLFTHKPKVLLMHHVHRSVLLKELPVPVNWLGWALEGIAMPLVYRGVSIAAVSQSTRDDVVRFKYTNRPVRIITNGVDHDRLRPSLKADLPTVLYLGRIVPYKRVSSLIEQFAVVLESVPEAQLIIAGKGSDLNNCRELVSARGLINSVKFEGWVSEARKTELLGSAWVLAQPSEIEGWGISVIEAAACATPAVAMNVKGLRDSVLDGRTGLLTTTWTDFANALRRVLLDRELRLNLSTAAHANSMKYSWESTARQTLALLEETVRQHGLL